MACTHWLASGNKNIIPPSSSYKVRTGVLAKQTFRRTKVGNLDDIANVISTSSFVNVPQLVGTLDGDYFVPTYNWSEFFEEHTKKTALKGITQMQHFHFKATSPGTVFVKSSSSSNERQIVLVKDPSWRPSPHRLPSQVVPDGLSTDRQYYLYDKIREFCPDYAKDLVCPQPTVTRNS